MRDSAELVSAFLDTLKRTGNLTRPLPGSQNYDRNIQATRRPAKPRPIAAITPIAGPE
jgi:hypothetical protein